jgi:hypothetical protein
MAGFRVVFCVFFDLGVLELRVEKKKPQKNWSWFEKQRLQPGRTPATAGAS